MRTSAPSRRAASPPRRPRAAWMAVRAATATTGRRRSGRGTKSPPAKRPTGPSADTRRRERAVLTGTRWPSPAAAPSRRRGARGTASPARPPPRKEAVCPRQRQPRRGTTLLTSRETPP
ncbi:hypothetical protein BU14_0053s0015 [Porphyra umbilicalis]|uniref:Uncharacterized protein n=1 Tax=Porphyra umbilicalis TaxID=2786 RepID=A0A1X6PHM2_PORUM|nr:hypothetical protein BU14_0053s0015 [Porphyra umbilicalis]|eukprot:OSX80351.1 hypothetical protein BU14_0053s0015 [Porphyra umbilicalis]